MELELNVSETVSATIIWVMSEESTVTETSDYNSILTVYHLRLLKRIKSS